MGKINLILGSVNTFSLGASNSRVDELYQNHLRPFIQAVYARPSIQLTMYYSGAMIDWLEENKSEYLTVLAEIFTQKRLEFLGGGYFDPIFPVIPKLDRIGQIEHLTTRIRQICGKRPHGAWLSNFFWEPDIPGTLHTAGIEYTFLDDTFFQRAGMEEKDLLYPAITEDQGKTLVVFPISGTGRSMFWKKSPEQLMEWIISQGDRNDGRVLGLVYDANISTGHEGDEAEQKKLWLDRFLDLLEEAQVKGLVETVLPPRLLKAAGYMTRAYFEAPTIEEVHGASVGQSITSSHGELQVLLPGINRLGYFAQKNVRHSLARYPEANLLYAKMQYIHSLVSQLKGDKYRKQASRESLWKAQNHAAYWHGPDGGLYRNLYRKAAYRNLIDSEKATREKGIFAPGVVSIDFDFDGVDELLYQGNELNAYIHCKGGMLFELDYLANPWNYADTCSRHPEMYHLSADEAEGYDAYPRRMFLDHFIKAGVSLDDFNRCNHVEQGSFLHDTYTVQSMDRESHTIVLSNRGSVDLDGRRLSLDMEKTYRFQKNHIMVKWQLRNTSQGRISSIFSPELNLGFASQDQGDLRVFTKEGKIRGEEIGPSSQVIQGYHDLSFHDQLRKVTLHVLSSHNDGFWMFPLVTSVKTTECIIHEYQATCLMPRWTIDLEPGAVFEADLELVFLKTGS